MKNRLLKMKMLEHDRDDFNKYLAEILNTTEATASRKLNGETKFSLDDVKAISKELNLSLEEIDSIFIGIVE